MPQVNQKTGTHILTLRQRATAELPASGSDRDTPELSHEEMSLHRHSDWSLLGKGMEWDGTKWHGMERNRLDSKDHSALHIEKHTLVSET